MTEREILTEYYAYHYDDLHREGKLGDLFEDSEFDEDAITAAMASDDWESVLND